MENLKLEQKPLLHTFLAEEVKVGQLFEEMNKLEKARDVYNLNLNVNHQ